MAPCKRPNLELSQMEEAAMSADHQAQGSNRIQEKLPIAAIRGNLSRLNSTIHFNIITIVSMRTLA